jgi:hypothetical protein
MSSKRKRKDALAACQAQRRATESDGVLDLQQMLLGMLEQDLLCRNNRLQLAVLKML